MSIVHIPIIKDKRVKISNTNNYRPIAFASTASKICECILLDRLNNVFYDKWKPIWFQEDSLHGSYVYLCIEETSSEVYL